jgi:mannitol operon transcriptional antiterminator
MENNNSKPQLKPNISSRSLEILTILLQSDAPIAASAIAEKLKITPRMVQYSLIEVERWLSGKELALVKKPHQGLSIAAPERVRRALLRRLSLSNNSPAYLSPADRLNIILLTLFISSQPVLAKQMAASMKVSSPTMLKDMDRAEEWLHAHRLSLTRRPHYGFRISGNEVDWREAAAGYLLDTIGTMPLLALCNGSMENFNQMVRSHSMPWNDLYSSLQGMDWIFAKQVVDQISKDLNREFTDNSYMVLVLQFVLLIQHINEDRTSPILDPDLVTRMNAQPEIGVVRQALKKVEQHAGRAVPEQEAACITMQLLAAKIGGSVIDPEGKYQSEANQPEVLARVNNILNEASIYLHPSLRVDQDLIRSLAFHLSTALDRLRYGFPIRNPLLAEIKKQYPYIYKIAKRSTGPLEQSIGRVIPEEEVGFIAMHLGAAMERLSPSTKSKMKAWIVCGEGIATAWLLVSKLKTEFPELEVVEVMSAMEASHKKPDRDEVDLIISTLPFDIKSIPVVSISALFTENDKNRIRNYLRRDAQVIPPAQDDQPTGELALSDLLKPDTIQLQLSAQDWNEVVELAGAPLVANKSIKSGYVEAMKDIIVKHGPYMVVAPGVVLLHARPDDGVNRLCVGLITLQNPVNFGQSTDCFIDIAVTLGAVDNHSHLKVLSQIATLLDDPNNVKTIRSARSKGEILNLVARYSNK